MVKVITKLTLLVAMLILFSGCSNDEKYKRYMKAIELCGKQGGVPMLNIYGRMTDCKFNTISKNESMSI